MQKRPIPPLLDEALKRHFSIQQRLTLIAWLVFTAIAASSLAPAKAAEPSAAAASAFRVLTMPLAEANGTAQQTGTAASHGGPKTQNNSITVLKGESIDAAIRRGLPGLPLRDEFMRQALAKANPKIFPKGQTYPVRPGTVLALPSHEELRQLILSQHPNAAALFQASSSPSLASEQSPAQDKRRWVHFP